MSPDLEQRIREAWDGLPLPAPAATRRAREAVLRARRRLRWAIPFALALAVAVGGGLAVGLKLAPASSGPAGLGAAGIGFLPAEGWTVIQTGSEATSARPARAIAANVPIHPEDRPHRLPYRTLLALPADGIVLVAIFATISEAGDASHPPPLRVTDARRELAWGAVEIRPERPLGRLQLRAPAGGYHVDVRIYFGERNPSARALAEAQRQLDRLVISG